MAHIIPSTTHCSLHILSVIYSGSFVGETSCMLNFPSKVSCITQTCIWVYDNLIYWKTTKFITLYFRTAIWSPQSFTAVTVRHTQTSIGSTSCAITTSWAFFCSTNLVTQLLPWRKTFGLFVGVSSFFATFASACARRLAFFAYAVSGRYFSKTLNSAWAKIN